MKVEFEDILFGMFILGGIGGIAGGFWGFVCGAAFVPLAVWALRESK